MNGLGHGSAPVRVLRIGALYVALLAIGALFATPVAWMLSSSLHTLPDVFAQPYRWLPAVLQWDNYVRAVTILPVPLFLWNTILITVPVMAATALSSALVAYGFARFRFPGRDLLFSLCLATMMLPGQVTMIPLYILFARLGWVDTYLPLIVPADKPLMKCCWAKKNRTTLGRSTRSEAAMRTFHSTTPEPRTCVFMRLRPRVSVAFSGLLR